MDMHDWKKIQPIYAYQKRTGTTTFKKYRTMPKFKWSNLLKVNIYKHTKLPCTWTLKREKVVKNKIFVKGNCSQCTAHAKIESYETTDKINTIYCKITNIDRTVKHNPTKKFKLTPYKRQQLSKILRYKPAIVVHNEMASEILGIKNDEKEVVNTPALPSLSCLRQIKSEARRKQWLDPNPIIGLVVMAKSTHKNVIRSFSVHPSFFVYYWNENQIDYYNLYLRKFGRVTVTIDATGSFFETMRLPDGTKLTKRLFLYAGLITANLKLKSVPVLQMVTDAHDKNSILHWLNQWKKSVDRSPHEIISDDSSALIAANTEAFTEFSSTKEYIKNMFSILEGQTSILEEQKPSTFIRLDTSHFVKTLHNLKCFNDVEPGIKYFYIRCILFLKECENFETAKEIIGDMIQICLSHYDDESNPESSNCQVALNRLALRMKNIELDHAAEFRSMEDDKQNDDEDFGTEEHHTANIDFFTWLDDKIAPFQKQSMEVHKNNKNVYFLPTFMSDFRRILGRLPLWSNLLCSFFKADTTTPSSSGIESYFKTLKNLLFKTKLQKFRIDEFIKIHCQYLDGEIALAKSDLISDLQNKEPKRSRKKKYSFKKSQSQVETSEKQVKTSQTQVKKRKIIKSVRVRKINRSFDAESIFSDQPSFIENWRGEAETDSLTKIKIKFVKNGNLCDAVSVGENSIKIDLRNTCSFDSVIYLLSIAFIQSRRYQETLNTYPEDLIPQYIKLISDSASTDSDIHKMRTEIGLLYFDTTVNSSCEFACNVSYIFEHVALKYCFSAIFTKKCTNDSCHFIPVSRKIAFLPLNLNIISVFGLQSLEDATLIADQKTDCTFCNKQTVCKYTLSNTISYELNGCEKFRVREIPEFIMFSQKSYKLIGAVEFIPPIIETGTGHYKCHYLTPKDEIFCYDDYDSKIRISTDQPIFIHSITYSHIDC